MLQQVNRINLKRKINSSIVCGILLLMLFSNVASAAHTFDTSAVRYTTTTAWGTTNPNTLSYTAGTGSSVMVLGIVSAVACRTPGTPTFNGKSFTQITTSQIAAASPEGCAELWYLILTPSDTGTAYIVSVPNTATLRAINYHVATFKAQNGYTSAFDVGAGSNGTTTNPGTGSITTTANGDVLVSELFTGLQTMPTVTSPGTQLYSNDPGNYGGAFQYYLQATAGAQQLRWTSGTSDDWGAITAAFKEVAPTYIPPSPTGLSMTQGNFWINYTWGAGSGNLTNSYNVSVNGTWTNGSSNTYKNTSVGPHGWSNLSVFAFNSSGAGTLSAIPLSQNAQVANNPVTIGNVSGSSTITAGNTLSIYPTSSDLDVDTPTFARNFTNGTFYTNNGTLLWTTTGSDTGIHSWQINVTDGFGSVSPANFTVTVTPTPTYSLNTTYTFTETNSSATWQSISIKDRSYGDALANVSILNATSRRWESILTTPFTGGASPIEHVNVIKGASGNSSSYDAGGGQIKIRYNWTNSASNNNLGVDLINVTVLYKSTFLLNITMNTTSVPVNYSNYYLEINYSCDTNETGYDVYVYNGSVWNLKGNLTSTNWTLANFTLSSSEVINGNVSVRYIDQTPAGTSQGNLYIDYQRTHGFIPGISGSYRLNVTTNTTDIPHASNHDLQLRYNVSGDNFTLQIWNGSLWNNKTILNDTSLSYRNITLLPNELILDGVNKSYTLVRYLGMNASTTQQGTLYLDYQRIYNVYS